MKGEGECEDEGEDEGEGEGEGEGKVIRVPWPRLSLPSGRMINVSDGA